MAAEEETMSGQYRGEERARPRKPGPPPKATSPQQEAEKKLRRRIEDRLRKDREALHLVAKILNYE